MQYEEGWNAVKGDYVAAVQEANAERTALERGKADEYARARRLGNQEAFVDENLNVGCVVGLCWPCVAAVSWTYPRCLLFYLCVLSLCSFFCSWAVPGTRGCATGSPVVYL